jgi:hypothetical protein
MRIKLPHDCGQASVVVPEREEREAERNKGIIESGRD